MLWKDAAQVDPVPSRRTVTFGVAGRLRTSVSPIANKTIAGSGGSTYQPGPGGIASTIRVVGSCDSAAAGAGAGVGTGFAAAVGAGVGLGVASGAGFGVGAGFEVPDGGGVDSAPLNASSTGTMVVRKSGSANDPL